MKRRLMPMALLVALPLLIGGCEGRKEAPDPAALPFPGAAASLQELGFRVLDGLVQGDTLALETLRLSEAEHNEIIWPELPASRPEVNFPVELAWENIQLRNRRDLYRILPWFRGRDLELRSVECRGRDQRFPTFLVRTDCHVILQDPEMGPLEVQIFKDVAVRNGGYKIFRYYEEDPRPYPARNPLPTG